MSKLFTTLKSSDFPYVEDKDKRFRYPRPPLPPGWTRYTIIIPAGKERPD
jgi:hypothetical protein